MNVDLPRWLWVLLIVCLIVLIGNVLHLWTIHFQFGV